MPILWRGSSGADANQVASQSAAHSGAGRVTAIISAIALVFSGYSLWETSLKQADLGVYVSGIVSYVRDTTDDENIRPSGGFEVLAVPITIANGGRATAPSCRCSSMLKTPRPV